MMFFAVMALVYLGFFAVAAVFTLATALAAWLAGITVEKVELGTGPRLMRFAWKQVEIELRPLAITASVKMLGRGDRLADASPPPHSYPAAPVLARVCVALVGPISQVFLGVLLLCLPVWLAAPQFSATYASEDSVTPRAVPLLYQHREAAHPRGQWQLWLDLPCEYALRLLTFRSMAGYGGYVGFWVTTAAVALRSPINGLGFLGLYSAARGVADLLPLPSQGGGRACLAIWEGLTRRRVSENAEYYLVLASILLLLVLAARMLWLDATWLATLATVHR